MTLELLECALDAYDEIEADESGALRNSSQPRYDMGFVWTSDHYCDDNPGVSFKRDRYATIRGRG